MVVDVIFFRAAGVTFNNPDGSSRQKALNRIRKEEVLPDVTFVGFDYKGEQAFYIRAGYYGYIGTVPAEYVDAIVSAYEKGYEIYGTIDDILGLDEFGERIPGYNLGAEISVSFIDKSIPCPEPAQPVQQAAAPVKKKKKKGTGLIALGVIFALGFFVAFNPFCIVVAAVCLFFGIRKRKKSEQ